MEPITREEILIAAAATGKTPSLTPITREEMFLAKAAGMDVNVPEPITRKEMFLSMITGSGDSGEVVDDLEIVPDFSAGDYKVVAPTGLLVRSAIIKKPKTLVPDNIAEGVEIAGVVGTHAGGGEVEKPFDCHSVTFVYGDKSYVRSVADGDTCADPVERGLIPTPTKESTAQYNYTFYGWGASDGGAADANILKNITEDKTVYAVFTATVRYYTITWLDDDGTTVLNTTSVGHGSVPSYTPTKDGVVFDKWIPTPTAVTGDTSYTVQWRDPTVVYIANEQTQSVSSTSAGYYYGSWSYIAANFPGKSHACVVTWDGVEYNCTLRYNAKYTNSAGSTVQLRYSVGDPTIRNLSHSTYTSDAPFFFQINANIYNGNESWTPNFYTKSSGNHTFSIRLIS